MIPTSGASNVVGLACGYVAPVAWCSSGEAGALAAALCDMPGSGNVTANPHRTQEWAAHAVRSEPLLGRLMALIGADIAVENTFLMIKHPGDQFTVPPHQDGINDRIELDPTRSVAVWLSITEATEANGCLAVLPCSHRDGYLPYERVRGPRSRRPLSTTTPGSEPGFVTVPLAAGQACLLDVRLIHRSGPNQSPAPRIGLNIRYVAPGGWTLRDGPPPDLFPVAGTSW